MIAKMTKYSFLVFHKEYEKFLEKIRDLGVVHVQTKDSGIPEDKELDENLALLSRMQTVESALEDIKEEGIVKIPVNIANSIDVLSTYEALLEEKNSLTQENQKLDKEISFLKPWGDVSSKTIAEISDSGYAVKFFSCPATKYDKSWEKEYNAFVLSDEGTSINFVTIALGEVEIDADSIILPDSSLSELQKHKSINDEKLSKLNEQLFQLSGDALSLLKEGIAALKERIDLRSVTLGSDAAADNKLMILEGWIPKDEQQSLDVFLKNNNVFYESREAVGKDRVPVLLKNNAFTKLFEPIGELYTLPTHKELDLTPFFAPFYMLFFGFCLGDAGYGFLIMLGTLLAMRKATAKVKPLLTLGFLLGLSTTIMGIVGGTFFGIMLHPADYKSAVELPQWIKNYQRYILSGDNLMMVALGLGYFQVLFGMFLNAVNKIIQYGFKHALAQFGWIVIVLVTIPFYGLTTMEIVPESIGTKVWIGSLLLGAIPALFMNTPGKNIFLNFGTGLWDAYGMASGLLGDVLSYIRLFALGLSSAILGNVFNSLAMDLSGDTPVVSQIVMVIILLFGHGLNFFMAALGSFVHPLRLTFVEFYKNSGFDGGGEKFSPFKRVQ